MVPTSDYRHRSKSGQQYCHKCKSIQDITNFRLIKIRGKQRHDTQCNKCIFKKDKIKYQKLLIQWEKNPEDKKTAHKKQYQSILKRMKNNPTFEIIVRCRDRFKSCLRSGQEWKSHLGCSVEFLRNWFEYQFESILLG